MNERNYLSWSISVKMLIYGKGKYDYLSRKTPVPNTDQKYKTWQAENNMIMSWPINSMTTKIGEGFLLFSTANKIWEAAHETYSDKKKKKKMYIGIL